MGRYQRDEKRVKRERRGFVSEERERERERERVYFLTEIIEIID